jgi:hypothetical protein
VIIIHLYEYIGKKVKVETFEGNTFEGTAIGVDDEDDNESGYYSLNIKLNRNDDVIIDLDEVEISSIEIIK